MPGHPSLATARDHGRLSAISTFLKGSIAQPEHGITADCPRHRWQWRHFLHRIPIRGITLLALFLGAVPLVAEVGELEKAKALYQDKHYAEAQAAFEKIIATEPGNPAAAYHLGALALRRGEVPEAIRQLEAATRMDPTSALYQQELGDAYGAAAEKAALISKLGLAKKALSAYQRAIKLEPESIEHRLRLMNYYAQAPRLAAGGIEKAYDVAETIRTRDPLQGGLAIISLHLGEKRWPQAFAEIDALQPLHSENPHFLYLLARVCAASGQQLDRGETALLHYLSLAPSKGPATPAQANSLLGTIREKAGNRTGAITAHRALALDGNLTAAHEALGRLQGATPGK